MKLGKAVIEFLAALNLVEHPEVVGTPERVERMWRQNLVAGYDVDPKLALDETRSAPSSAVVAVTHFPFHRVCPHHLLPFLGKLYVAYMPGQVIAGLWGLKRLVTAYFRWLILSEQLCARIADSMFKLLGANGAVCAIEADHHWLSLSGGARRSARVCSRFGVGCLVVETDLVPRPNGSTVP